MSMSFIAGAAAAFAIGGLVIGGLAVSPGDGAFEQIRPIAAPESVRNLAPARAVMPARRVTSDREPGLAPGEAYGERFRYAD